VTAGAPPGTDPHAPLGLEIVRSGPLVALQVGDGARVYGLAAFEIAGEPGARRLVWARGDGGGQRGAAVDPARAGDVWPLLVRGLGALLDEVGTAVLEGVPERDPLLEWLGYLPRGWTWCRDLDADTPRVTIARTG
jgi:hypothetical protein